MFGLIRALGNFAVAPAPPAPSGTGGPTPARRRFDLDVKPTKRQPIPERKVQRRRTPPVHVALSLATPSPVVVAEVTVAPLLAVTMAVRLPRVSAPALAVRAQVTSALGLAQERNAELELMLAAVLEDD